MTKQGDNIVAVEAADFKRHVAKISAKKIAKEAADAEYKTARQEAKAGGITLGSLDQAIRLANMPRDERDQTFSEISQYANWLGAVEIGAQLDMFNHSGPGPEDMAKAYGAGEMAGLTGQDPSGGKHAPGSGQHQEWMRGWHEGWAIFQKESVEVGVEPLGPDDTGEKPTMPYYKPSDEEVAQYPSEDGGAALVDGGADGVEPFDPDEGDAEIPQENRTHAFDEGWAASAAGEAQSECPYETGSPLRGVWLEGFDKERASQE